MSLALLASGGCAYDSNRYIPVFSDQPRVRTLGFSVKPPTGSDWYEKVNKDSLYYLKKSGSNSYCLYTKATELHLDRSFPDSEDFLAYLKSSKTLEICQKRFIRTRLSYEKNNKSEYCVRYRQTSEDLGNAAGCLASNPPRVKVNSNGLICLHPSDRKASIDPFYSERTIPGVNFVTNADEAERFIDSLAFLPFDQAL